MMNLIYGKTMKNVINGTNVTLVSNEYTVIYYSTIIIKTFEKLLLTSSVVGKVADCRTVIPLQRNYPKVCF